MIEFTATHFDDLCRSQPVAEQLGSLEVRRKAALKRFWLLFPAGVALGAAAIWSLTETGWPTVAWVVGLAIGFVSLLVAAAPLLQVGEDLKVPVLEGLAARAGMEYLSCEFVPPAYQEARRLLFGGGLSAEIFTDLFHGVDPDGLGYAVYEARLNRRAGKNNVTVFQGQLYGLQRHPDRAQGVTVVMPDRKLFNFFKPARDMERVAVGGDPAFEKKFEIYSTAPDEARLLLSDGELRQLLLDMRSKGRVWLYAGPAEALVGHWGGDRFEPGSMFRRRDGRDRVRLMFDDVCASLSLLKRLREKLA